MKHTYALTILLCACGDPLVEPQELIDTRALGVRLSLASDPDVMSVRPGDEAQLRLLVAAPSPRPISAILSFCANKPITLGVPECAESPFATEFVEGTTGADLQVPFLLSPRLNSGDEWIVQAAVCDDASVGGKTAFQATCDDGEPPLELFYRSAAAGTEQNRNPNLQDDEVRLNGKLWPARADVTEDCKNSPLPQLHLSDEGTITVRLSKDDRESLPDGSDAPREALLFSHTTNAPGLERAYSAIEANSPSKSFDLSFTPVVENEHTPKVVTFHLVVRDGRGGTDWLNRQLCLID